MADDFLEVKKHFEAFSKKRDGALKDLSCFLEQISPKCEEMADEREKLKKKYGLGDEEKFNIVREVNDDWKEPVHSKLLRGILDPKKLVIGGRKNLLQFFRLIGLSDDEIAKWNVDEVFVETEVTEKKLCEYLDNEYKKAKEESEESGVDIKVLKRERESRIDILICDKKNCVIIESKIKEASDEPDQLQRYVRIVQRQGQNVCKIVYIPPVYRDAPDGCDEEYRKEQKQIEENKWLVVVPAVRSKADKGKVKSLVQDFFPSIRGEFSEENKTRLVFFDQYEKILAKLGEDEIMKGIEKEVVALLCGTKENQKRTNDLRELLKDDDKFYELKCELLLEKVNADYGMNFVRLYNEVYGKKFQSPKDIEGDVYFYFYHWGYGIISKDCTKKAFKGLMDKVSAKISNSSEFENGVEEGWQWYGIAYAFVYDLSIEELARIVKERYEEFKKAVEK